MASAATSSSATANAFAKFRPPFSSAAQLPPTLSLPRRRSTSAARRICASASAVTPVPTKPDDLVEDIISKVVQTDRGVLLKSEEHLKVAELAEELQRFCVDEPVKCPLIFGEWDVLYCSNPTSPGGGYRSAVGRLVFKTKEMMQAVEAPDIVRNRVSFSLLGFLDGEMKNGYKVVFEPPELKVGGLQLKYGGESEVKLQITYIDKKIRLGKGSRGSLFVFQRCKA
ncbi:plastid-lipid associated protein PAP / fibrillinfamily protein [Striga asiatica]|uniref:Plastid-lipid associated protein PAP / fibrillinfamily protein n=1 Tax=Striga asiatica TaxID=4170 RepID=A0A5A7Q3N0_STRAF|nr:plastid-lipid associated protein PAP / fibrillinfamily protein [Striga asiatica]